MGIGEGPRSSGATFKNGASAWLLSTSPVAWLRLALQARRVHRSLGAGLHAKLRKHVRHVILDRLLGEEHLGRDLSIGQAFRDQLEDPALLVRQLPQRLVTVVATLDAVEQLLDERRIEQRLPAGDSPHCVDDVVATNLLQEITRGPGNDCLEQRLVVGERSEDETLGLGVGCAHVATDLDTVAIRQAHVEDRHIRPRRWDARKRLPGGSRFPDNGDVGLRFQEIAHTPTNHLVVIEQEDPDLVAGHAARA
jgi:hypothetical protein